MRGSASSWRESKMHKAWFRKPSLEHQQLLPSNTWFTNGTNKMALVGYGMVNNRSIAQQPQAKQKKTTMNEVAAKQEVLSKCGVCNEEPGHALELCTQFLDMSVDCRVKGVFDLDNCFRCLWHNHFSHERKSQCDTKSVTAPHADSRSTLIHGASRAAPVYQSRPSDQGRFLLSSE